MGRELLILPAEINFYKIEKPGKAELILPFNRDVFGNEEEQKKNFTKEYSKKITKVQ